MRLGFGSSEELRAGLLGLVAVVAAMIVAAMMWWWTVDHVTRDVAFELHGIHTSAVVLSIGDDPKNPIEMLSLVLPDGQPTYVQTSAVASMQPPGSTIAVVYLPGRPSSVEETDYQRWWWVGDSVMPIFGTLIFIAGLLLLRLIVRALSRRPGDPRAVATPRGTESTSEI